ncbi:MULTISPECIES: phytanoyl-CoA dioxygenase family protein [Pseudomonas syringae group]|uniref:Phytanoil-CoA alpha hydroxylase protein n=2 Tax=Pseudomonas syringae group TaxID=136849 RepID=A0A3M5G7Q3_PSESS|nr:MULTISPECIES: hypothetical protein [Pseudomonas syringae group]KPX05461.1 hypothetical protein ALO74_200096 [Pseudomonas syringae pv. cunninghamiae]KPW91514.1 Phytanoil-CoA alpha hydroxylase protein [Pseudomonas syringae pv. castaneae]KWS92793.1 hypothetical protein AL048_00040 [Pseudomonas syringae pv. castaneae]RMS82527.1 Phytanoil-CoA alpha hydroxylase protein [Pseudomonas savastanoi]RMV12549.1 hypothetical protein ALP16_200172 [Pseudomonas savastanoi]
MSRLSLLKDAYEREGYVIVRELLDNTTLKLLAAKVLQQLSSNRVTNGFTCGGQPRFKEPLQPDADLLKFADAMRCELTEELFQNPRVMEVMRGLLDTEDVFVHPVKWIRGLAPVDSSLHCSPGVHQDFPELQGSGRQITLWAPFFHVDEGSGSLPVYNKKPGETLLPLELALNPSGWQVCPEVLGHKNVFELNPGDVLLFNTFTPHGGATNTGEGWRCSIEARFQPLADPLAISNFAKPLLTQDWQTFYEGWDTWGFYWKDRHPPLVEFDPSWERWRDLTAIGEAVKGNKNAVMALEIAAQFGMSEPIRSCAQRLLESFERVYDQ